MVPWVFKMTINDKETGVDKDVPIYDLINMLVSRHSEVPDNIIHLARRTFSLNCVRGKPLIHQCCIRSNEKVRHRRG